MAVDDDLQGLWEFHPGGAPGVNRTGGIEVVQESWGYDQPPYRFRAYKQNGSRLWLRMLNADGTDRRYPNGILSGTRIERRAYTSDMRRGIYWTRPTTNGTEAH